MFTSPKSPGVSRRARIAVPANWATSWTPRAIVLQARPDLTARRTSDGAGAAAPGVTGGAPRSSRRAEGRSSRPERQEAEAGPMRERHGVLEGHEGRVLRGLDHRDAKLRATAAEEPVGPEPLPEGHGCEH